jgi:hypothetical protein
VKITFQVTQEDIAAGLMRDCEHCPIANAMKRKFPNALDVTASDDELYLRLPGGRSYDAQRLLARTPAPAVNFISRFDEGLAVEPFEFEVEFRDLAANGAYYLAANGAY